MVVQSHRCQNSELLLGKVRIKLNRYKYYNLWWQMTVKLMNSYFSPQNSSVTRITFPAIQLVPANDRCRLVPKTIVRMSLVDERSSATNILDHFHCLVDCQSRAEPTWRVEREMNPDGTVLFEKFGIVKTLETDKVDRITKRIIERKVENGDFKLSTDTWRKTRIKDDAEKQCGTVNNFYPFMASTWSKCNLFLRA